MLLIPALGRQRKVDLCEFEASLVYRMSSRTARTVTQRNLITKSKQMIFFLKEQREDVKSSVINTLSGS